MNGGDLWEVDGLGYYPDGAKRTLTDEHIAMFRHSEIYNFVRARQVRKENLEAEGHLKHETPEGNINSAPVRSMRETSDKGSGVRERKHVSQRKQYQSAGPSPSKRRKINQYQSRQGDVQPRRYVRELDDVVNKEEELDYGE